MDSWQLEHVVNNLGDLQRMTECNALLIAALRRDGILSHADEDSLNTCLVLKGKFSQSALLYSILQTRLAGYETITKAVFECRQSGALKILLNGFRQQKIPRPLTKCSIHINHNAIFESIVHFHGKECKFQDIFKGFREEDMASLMRNTSHLEDDYIDIFITRQKTFVLLEQTVPPEPFFYAPRPISSGLKLNPKIFKENCPDVFVFKEIDRIILTELAHPSSTSTSSNQIIGITTRFILLDDSIDWQEIQKLCSEQNCPAHLIKCVSRDPEDVMDNQIFMLESTTGNSKFLWKCVETQPLKERNYISEDQFIENIEENDATGFCICDTPGMGKSWLLANLARKVLKCHPERIVVYIPLVNFIHKMKQECGNVQMTKDIALELVLGHVSPTQMSQAILKMAIHNDLTKLELFFNGLDEVAQEDLPWAKMFLKSFLQNSEKANVYVTTRPQLRREIESTLGIISYDILPFNEINQSDYLVQSWKEMNSKSQESKLVQFAATCLDNLKEKLTNQERDIMGIPLQCFLLAQVYRREAELYSDPRRKHKLPLLKPTTIFQMYKRFMEMRFQIVDGPRITDSNISCWNEIKESESLKVKNYHLWKALQLLSPEVAVEYARSNQVEQLDTTDNHYLSFGILEVRYNASQATIEFIHRTLAEFLVAEYFAEALMDQGSTVNEKTEMEQYLISYIAKEILKGESTETLKYNLSGDFFQCTKFSYPVIAYFLNEHLVNVQQNSVAIFVADIFINAVMPQHFYEMLQSCISQNCLHLFLFLKHLIPITSTTNQQMINHYLLQNNITVEDPFEEDEVYLVEPAWVLLCRASYVSSVSMVRECFQLSTEVSQYYTSHVCSKRSNDILTPLHWAVRRVDYELVELFVDKFTLENRSLLYECIADTYQHPIEVVRKRIDLCKLLFKHNSNLLNEPGYCASECTGPLVAGEVHLEILKYLIKRGSDWQAINNFDGHEEIFLCYVNEYMCNDDFHQLCCFIITNINLVEPMSQQWCILFPQILQCTKHIEGLFLKIFKNPSVNIAAVEEINGDNIILSAVRRNQNITVLRELVQVGANFKLVDKMGRGALHLAADAGNIETYLYFLSLGLSSSVQDNNGKFPLHYATENLEMLKCLLENGSDPLVKDNQGNTIAHLVAAGPKKNHKFNQFVDLLERFPIANLFKTKNNKGITPLHEWLQNESIDTDSGIAPSLHEILVNFPKCHEELTNLFLLALKGKKNIRILSSILHQIMTSLQNKNNGNDFKYVADDCVNHLLQKTFEEKLNSRRNGNEAIHFLEVFLMLAQHFHVKQSHETKTESTGNMENAKIVDENFSLDKVTGKSFAIHCWSELMREGFFQIMLVNVFSNNRAVEFAELKILGETGNNTIPDCRYEILSLSGVALFKKMVDIGMPLMERDTNGSCFCHRLPQCFTKDQFHEIVECLVQTEILHALELAGKDGITPLHLAVYRLEILPQTLDILIGSKSVGTSQLVPVDVDVADEDGKTILHWATLGRRSITFLKRLLTISLDNRIPETKVHLRSTVKIDVMKQTRKGNTFLHILAEHYSSADYHQIAEVLIQMGATELFRISNVSNATPLHLAIYHLELLPETIDLIFQPSNSQRRLDYDNKQIAEWNATEYKGNTILHIAVLRERSLSLLQKLINIGKQISSDYESWKLDVMKFNSDGVTFAHIFPRHYSSEQFHEMVEFLIENDLGEIFRLSGTSGANPIHWAVRHLDILPQTIDVLTGGISGNVFNIFPVGYVDLNAVMEYRNSLMHCAIGGKRGVEFIKHLINLADDDAISIGAVEHKLDIMKQNHIGDTFVHILPFFYTSDQYHEVIEYVIGKGYGHIFKIKNRQGETPLQRALYALELLPTTLNMLVSQNDKQESGPNVDLNAIDNTGRSILHWAVIRKRSLELIKELVHFGANWKAQCHNKTGMIHTASSLGLVDHIKYFVQLGCDINEADNDGDNALHCVVNDASTGVHEIVKFLVSAGVNKHHRNISGKTALMLAADKGINDESILKHLR